MKIFALALITALSAAPTHAQSVSPSAMKWILLISWLDGNILQLQEFPDGHSCIDQLLAVHKIYENKGTLACALKWEKN
jgi:hypothetical protein